MAFHTCREYIRTVTLIWLFFSVASCNTRPGQKEEQDIKSCKAALAKTETYYVADPAVFKKAVDSYYSQNKDISPYCYVMRYITIAHYYDKRGASANTLLYLDSALGVFSTYNLQDKHINDYVSFINFKAQLLYAAGQFNEAYDNYFNARQLAERINDSCVLTDCIHHMGMICFKQEKYREAMKQFDAANQCALACRERPSYTMQQDLDNIALCYERLQLPDSALFYYDSALSFVHIYCNTFYSPGYIKAASAVIKGNIGSVLLYKGLADSAIPYLEESYKTDIQGWMDNHDALLVHLKLAKAYMQKNKRDTVYAALLCIKKELDSIKHSFTDEGKWLQLMYRYYSELNQRDSAFKYYQQYSDNKDSIWATEKKQLQADVDRELVRKEQTYQMNVLQKQNKLNGRYLFASMSFLGMALVIAVLVYINYRREKKNIKELTQLKDRLEVKDKEKDKILNIVAHDLRGPVSGIYMVADLMTADEHKTPEQQESIDMIKTASESAIALINQLMAYRKESREELAKEPADIMKLADDTVKILQLNANEKNITLRRHLASGPVIINVDKEKIKRVLTNLVGNAIKFSKPGSAIDISVQKKENSVLMTIKDTGIGIPEKYKSKVFDMFTESKREGTSGETSFGLGLSITRQITEAHGGRIWLESEEGKGTTFYVELPA